MGFKRYATAFWEGDLKSGKGAMSTPQSGLFADQRYSFNTRFGDEKGTNPEELLAAAHAGCFSMALGFMLGCRAGRHPHRHARRGDDGAGRSPARAGGRAPDRDGIVPGLGRGGFAAIAENAKENCVISRALGLPVTMEPRWSAAELARCRVAERLSGIGVG